LHLLEAVAGGQRHFGAVLVDAGHQPAEARHPGDQRRDQLGIVGVRADVAEGVDERHVRQSDVADLEAATDQHPGAAARGVRGQLGQQAGLAHARVAGHQRHRRPAGLGPLQQLEKLGELAGPADEGQAGRGGHAGKYRAGQ
jgi:hypothetical protein